MTNPISLPDPTLSLASAGVVFLCGSKPFLLSTQLWFLVLTQARGINSSINSATGVWRSFNKVGHTLYFLCIILISCTLWFVFGLSWTPGGAVIDPRRGQRCCVRPWCLGVLGYGIWWKNIIRNLKASVWSPAPQVTFPLWACPPNLPSSQAFAHAVPSAWNTLTFFLCLAHPSGLCFLRADLTDFLVQVRVFS